MQEAEAMICGMIYEVAFAWQVGPKGIYPVRTLQYPEKGTELSLTNQAASLKNATSQRKTLFRVFRLQNHYSEKASGSHRAARSWSTRRLTTRRGRLGSR